MRLTTRKAAAPRPMVRTTIQLEVEDDRFLRLLAQRMGVGLSDVLAVLLRKEREKTKKEAT